MKLKAALGWLGFVLGIAACGPGGLFEDSSIRATREAQNAVYEETLIFVQTQGATVIALQDTAEAVGVMGTQIIQLEAQNQALQGTLQALAAGAPLAQPPQPQPAAGQPGATPAPGFGSTPLFPDVSGSTPTPPPAAPSGVGVLSAVTATGVNDTDGCALDDVSVFETTEDEIYIVVAARNVEPGTTFFTRWLYNGQRQFDSVSWTPDTFFEQVCIWFYMEPFDAPFSPGNWTVELLANNQVAVSRTFQIAGADGTVPDAAPNLLDAGNSGGGTLTPAQSREATRQASGQ